MEDMEESFSFMTEGTLDEEYLIDDDDDNGNSNGTDDSFNSNCVDDDDFNDGDNSDEWKFLEERVEDKEEKIKVSDFLAATCRCELTDGHPCSSKFTYDDVLNYRAEMFSLARAEQELVVLTSIRMGICDTINSKGNERKNYHCTMYFKGQEICLETFVMLHVISKSKFYALLKHFRITDSIIPREHGNKGNTPHNRLSFEDVSRIKTFLSNYAAAHAVQLPGNYPGYKNLRVQLLESHITKTQVWELYSESCRAASLREVCYMLFIKLCDKLSPYLTIAKPRTDLCSGCQKHNNLMLKSSSLTAVEKLRDLVVQQRHLNNAETERLFYKRQCADARDEWRVATENNTTPNFTHISFDFAQQLHFPAPPDQPGALFFLTPRKCALFGICKEANFKQTNYLIDECVSIGKWPDCIISLIHHYFEMHIDDIRNVNIHADNCVGQNKNNYVVWYLLWRVLTGLSDNILYSFMIAGHTKFSCDACFGLLKKVTKRTFISSLTDIAKCVYLSSKTVLTNSAELVGLENGKLLIPYYDWKTFLASYFNKLPDITEYHHFLVSSKFKVGLVKCKKLEDTEELEFNVLKHRGNVPSKELLPQRLHPKGMSDVRKKYLYKEIRPYCRRRTEDLVGPYFPE